MWEIDNINQIGFTVNKEDIIQLISNLEVRRQIGNIKMLTIYVYNNEGNIPHFHIKKVGKQDCCIKILTNEYFIHPKHSTTLSRNELKLLIDFLNSKENNETYWSLIIKEWNKQSNIKVNINTKIPNYMNIN